jgi:Uma2 family endonuclease
VSTPEKISKRWSWRDLQLMPDDGLTYEVIDGELYVTPAPSPFHQTVSKRLQLELMLQLERTGRGIVFDAPIDLLFSAERSVQPDLLVLAPEKRPWITGRAIETAPDLVIEILSPSTASRDASIKARLYASEGVREYWIVDPAERTIAVLALAPDGFELRARYGPGDVVRSGVFDLEIPLDPVFE